MTIYRDWKGTKFPAQLRAGQFVMGVPAFGDRKHTAGNAVLVATEDEAERLVRRGFSLRVEAETGPRGSLVRLNLFRDGRRLT